LLVIINKAFFFLSLSSWAKQLCHS